MPIWKRAFNALAVASGTLLRWTNQRAAGRVMSKIARPAASRTYYKLSTIRRRRNSLLRQRWSELAAPPRVFLCDLRDLRFCPHRKPARNHEAQRPRRTAARRLAEEGQLRFILVGIPDIVYFSYVRSIVDAPRREQRRWLQVTQAADEWWRTTWSPRSLSWMGFA